MKKIALLSLVLLASVVLTGCGTKTTTPANTAPTPEAAAPTKESFSGTLEQLMAKGKAVKCTSASEVNGVKSEGEFYVDGTGGRSKIVSKTTQAGKTQTTNILSTKEYVYFWEEGQKQGFKYPAVKPGEATQPVATDKNLPGSEKQNEAYDFNCDAWNVDTSVFAEPAGVTFVDQGAILQDLQKKAGTKIPAGVNIPKY